MKHRTLTVVERERERERESGTLMKIVISILIITLFILFMHYKFKIASKTINDTTTFILEIATLFMMIILAIISVFIWKKKEFSPQKALLFITPIFCLIFSAVMPVGKGHDEYMHWLKAYEVSEGTLITSIYANIRKSFISLSSL